MSPFFRLVLYTLAWCLFPPLIYYKNRGRYRISETLDAFIVSAVYRKKIVQLLCKGRLLTAFELFWSSWNPIITTETTRPLYRLCGGNKYPLLSTAIVFLYSGIFLHALGCGLGSYWLIKLYTGALIDLGSLYVVFTYVSFGLLVMLSKLMRNIRRRKQSSHKKIQALPY